MKAYVDKVESKYDDFSMMDALAGYKKDVMEAFNDQRSRSNSPQGDQRGGKPKERDREDLSEDEAAKALKSRKSNSHNVDSAK